MKKRGLKALAVALVSTLSLTLFSVGAVADERDDWVQQQKQAENDRRILQEQLAGLDDELKDLFVKLDDVRKEIPGAKQQLAQAEEQLAAAQREHELVTEQLNAAVEEKDRIDSQIKDATDKSEKTHAAIALLAREVYRSGDASSSPLVLAMTTQSTADITERAAGAQTMAVAQSRALSAAREDLAVEKNRFARQEALTDRIGKLKVKAQKAEDAASSARSLASEKLGTLQELEATESKRANDVKKVQAEAKAQLEASERSFREARANIARIDEENRQKQIEFAQNTGGNAGGGGYVATSGILGYPFHTTYPITSPFGYRWHPVYGSYKLHEGIDYGASCGTPAIATANGVVAATAYDYGAGNYVVLNYGLVNGQSLTVWYMHLQGFAVSPGQRVSRGQTVGYVGTTGTSTGCHLHYQVDVNGVPTNPLAFM